MTLQSSGATVHFAVSLPEKSLEQLAEAGPHVMRRPLTFLLLHQIGADCEYQTRYGTNAAAIKEALLLR